MADAPPIILTRSRSRAAVVAGGGSAVPPPDDDGNTPDDAPPPPRGTAHNPYAADADRASKRPRTTRPGAVDALFDISDDADDEGRAGAGEDAEAEGGDGAVHGGDDTARAETDGGNDTARAAIDEGADVAGALFSTFNPVDGTEVFPIDVPDHRRKQIALCLAAVWGVASPRPFQVFAIFCMVYLTAQFIYLIRKTGEGKSLVILGTASMLRGVTVVLVPLIGLGSDQVNKSVRLRNRVEAYHVDENKGSDFLLLTERLVGMKTRAGGRARSSIILFCSPQSLGKPRSEFSSVLRELAKRNLITSIFIDEAHAVHREGMRGSNFRPEFDCACTNLLDIAKTQATSPNLCVMSATLTQPYRETISTIAKRKPTIVCWGDMARRSIFFGVQVIGQPSAAIKRQLATDYAKYPGRRVLIYTNSKTNAETTLTSCAESVLESLRVAGEVVPLTGDCGIMMKSMLMKAFCGKGEADDDDADDGDRLPNVLVMPCTSAANCGVSSNDCFRALRYSLPANMIDVKQEMGRVDRGHDAERGDHRYEVFLSFNVVMNLFLRILQNKTKAIRDYQLGELHTVLRFLVLPSCCYHQFIEQHFERPCEGPIRATCGDNCTFCTGAHLNFTKPIDRSALTNILTCDIFGQGKCSLSNFLKKLTENAMEIWACDEAFVKKELEPGNIHALALQLVAAQFVEIFVENEKLVGSNRLNKKEMYVRLAKAECGRKWRMCDATQWELFNTK